MPLKKHTLNGQNRVVFSVIKIKKNPAAVALGALGGLKGGVARAKKLSAQRRKEIATKAAEARWSQ